MGRSTDVWCYAQATGVIVQCEGDMKCKRREPASLDLADAVNVVLARRPYFRLLSYDPDL